MMEQSVDQGAVEIAGGGMDDHPGGLVDDDQMVVLEYHLRGDILRLVMGRGGGGDAYFVAAGQRLGGGIADERAGRAGDLAGADQRLEPLARQVRKRGRERPVEPPAL